MRLILVLFLPLLLLACSRPAGQLLVATDTNRPPLAFIDDQKQLAGFEIDLLRAVAAAEGLKVEFTKVNENGFLRAVPGFGILSGLDRDEYDAVVAATPASNSLREKNGVSDAYLNAGPVLVVAQGTATLADWKGGALAVLPGAPETEVAREPAAKDASRRYFSLEAALDDLTEGRVAGVLASGTDVAAALAENEKIRAFLRVTDGPLGNETTYGIIVKKGNAELLDRLNHGLKALSDSGALTALREKWLLR